MNGCAFQYNTLLFFLPMASTADKLVFKSTSADKAPGKGVHESVGNPLAYITLKGIKNFRRYLSNFDTSCSFVWTGPFSTPYTFRSIEHAFQAAKIHIADPAAAFRFTVESGDAIGLGDGAVAQKHRKLVKLTKSQLEEWADCAVSTMASAAEAKFAQNPDSNAARVLKATGSAELFHLVTKRGSASELVRFTHLEKIRESL
jgi:hypothetical protein